jgi:hypothetical protein
MKIYSVVNVKNLKLYEPPIIIYEDEIIELPVVDYFSPKYLYELEEDVILDKRIRTSQRGDVEHIRDGLKGVKPSTKKWMDIGKVRDLYPHLVVY